ncbi:MAG: hypothetical protein ACRDTV_24270, partial [Mycobacterium sp.]
GWVPPASWSPDASWPAPPPGWKLWVDDAPGGQQEKSRLSRVERTSDDVEYFGDDRAWSDASEQMPPHGQTSSGPPPSLPSQPTQVAPEDLSVHHLGRSATIKWDDEQRYVIGTIVAVTADSASISVKFAELESAVSFPRDAARRGPDNPRLYLWI